MKARRQRIPALQRAREEAIGGRLWRAKEILSGQIASAGYSPEAFAAYGRVLAEMHDSKEAGKFLFLSGLAIQEEESLTGLFLESVRGKPWQQVRSSFPHTAQKNTLADYPERVRVELKVLGFPNELGKQPIGCPPTLGGWLGKTIATMIGLGFITLIIAGLVNGLYFVFRLLFGD